ncbi:MAG TPA: ABC transporter permease [Ktedonobacteraceae bacterium]|jgi:ribose transport system permease protein|nr:ABC transporter permease [Ktedonobacteraceae bacterium]
MRDSTKSVSDASTSSAVVETRISTRQRLRERLTDIVAQLAAFGALVIVFIFLAFASPVFLTPNNLFNIVSQTTVNAIVAIGATFVIITAGIDLSVGSVSALAGVLGVMMMAHWGVSWPVAVLGGVVVGGLAGLVNGLLITVTGLNPFITTLGMMSVARGLVYVVTGSVAVYGGPDDFRLLGEGTIYGVPIPLIVLVVVAVVAYFVLTRTRLGRYTYAIGSNGEAARLSGIPIKKYLTIIYVLAGLLAGFGGMIASSRVASGQPNAGTGLELDVIAAAVIGGSSLFGGQGTVLGTLIGAFLIALIHNGSVLLNIDSNTQSIIIGGVIWLAVIWDQFRRKNLATVAQ